MKPTTKLTDYQNGQLLYIHFCNSFKYRTDKGTRVPSAQWRKMVATLSDGGYIEFRRSGIHLTAKGQEYVDANHKNFKPLS